MIALDPSHQSQKPNATHLAIVASSCHIICRCLMTPQSGCYRSSVRGASPASSSPHRPSYARYEPPTTCHLTNYHPTCNRLASCGLLQLGRFATDRRPSPPRIIFGSAAHTASLRSTLHDDGLINQPLHPRLINVDARAVSASAKRSIGLGPS